MSAAQQLLRFGVFELNLDSEELRKSGVVIKLAPQPFRLLVMLASRAGQVVTRDTIEQELWGGQTEVDFEHGMRQCINQIRSALGDNAECPLYVETVPRQGYRFLAPLTAQTVPAPPPKVMESASSAMERAIVDRVLARIARASTVPTGQTSVDTPATTPTTPSPAPQVEPAVPTSGRRIRLVLLFAAGAAIAAVVSMFYWYLH